MLIIPIGDEQPPERTPVVTYALLILHALLFFLFCFPGPGASVLSGYALIPDRSGIHSIFTSMFLQAHLLHLAGNLLFLWIFGGKVEEWLGPAGFAAFYVACGAAAALAHRAWAPDPTLPFLGASGAVSGAIAAYFVLFPHNRLRVAVWIFWSMNVFLVPPIIVLGLWIVEQYAFVATGTGGTSPHSLLGGLAAGAAAAFATRAIWARFGRRPRRPSERRKPASQKPAPRRSFQAVDDAPLSALAPEADDRWAVVRLEDEPPDPGVVARRLPREEADRLCRDLAARGIRAARIVDSPVNHPPARAPVEFASWTEGVVRLRVGDRVVPVPWSSLLLHAFARVDEETFVDLVLNRTDAFRVCSRARLTSVDSHERSESASDLAGFAQALADRRGGSPEPRTFKTAADYDDYLFWTYNLCLARRP